MRVFCLLMCVAILPSAPAWAADPQPPSSVPLPAGKNTWKIIFQDEFDGSTYNTSNWAPHADWGGNGSFNNGREQYFESQIQVHDGVCHLEAQPNPGVTNFTGSYRSGEILTCRDDPGASTPYKFTFQYGYIEARIKNVNVPGFFGAFWLLPAKPNYVYEWEVDILEMLANDHNTMYQTYHYREGLPYDQSRNVSWTPNWHPGRNGTAPDIDYTTDYHTFGLDWQTNHLTFYIDGIASGTFNNPGTNNQNIPNSPGYIIIQHMVENDWCRAAGNVLANTNMSETFYIDYVRVWQADYDAYLDADSDGMPDAWETKYFGSISNAIGAASSDPDNDGMCNLDEYKAGTDPTNRLSLLKILNIGRSTNNVVLNWQSVTGKTYSVQEASIITENFSTIFPGISVTGGTRWYTFPSSFSGSRFYRIAVE